MSIYANKICYTFSSITGESLWMLFSLMNIFKKFNLISSEAMTLKLSQSSFDPFSVPVSYIDVFITSCKLLSSNDQL